MQAAPVEPLPAFAQTEHRRGGAESKLVAGFAPGHLLDDLTVLTLHRERQRRRTQCYFVRADRELRGLGQFPALPELLGVVLSKYGLLDGRGQAQFYSVLAHLEQCCRHIRARVTQRRRGSQCGRRQSKQYGVSLDYFARKSRDVASAITRPSLPTAQ